MVVFLFLLMQFSAMFSMRPYMIPILEAHAIRMDAKEFYTILGALGIVANVMVTILVRHIGKRNIYLYSQIGNIIPCLALGKWK